MTLLNYSYAKLKDMDAFKAYVGAAAPLMAELGVEVVVRGRYAHTLRGEAPGAEVAAVFRFRDASHADRFYGDVRYQALVPLRDQACDMTIHFYEEIPA
ncbi:DUF1330 domain-containing protein [Leeia sp.]|uniref:DUF1330 domain-containing protein n=1 Tax=Leeia sp. TaxID=2884678 RepID=UPI0035B18368